MTIGKTKDVKISFIKETTPNTTPSTPALQDLRFTQEALTITNSTVVSDEMTAYRDAADLILVGQSNGGSINGEFSFGTYEKLLLAALFSDAADFVASSVTGTTIAATATGFTDSGNGFAGGEVEVGQFVKVAGFAGATINRYYRILTVADGEITTFPAPATTEAAGASVSITGSTAKNGETDHSFTVQKYMGGIGTPAYINFRGVRVSSFSMNMPSEAKITSVINLLGMSSELGTSAISGQSTVAKTTTKIMNTSVGMNNLALVGSGVSTAVQFTDISFNFGNALRELKALGVFGAADIRPGTLDITATINPYFEDIQLLTAFKNNVGMNLSFGMVDEAGNQYIISMPNVKITNAEANAGGKDADMIVNTSVRAVYDSVSGCSFRIDKFAA